MPVLKGLDETPLASFKPGYKTTEGWLSLLAFIGSCLVAVKAVPVNVNTAVQADAVKAIPVIAVGYAIARSIAKLGWRRTLPLIESELGIPTTSSTPTVTVTTGLKPPVFSEFGRIYSSTGTESVSTSDVPVSADPTAPAVTTGPAAEPTEPAPVAPADPPVTPAPADDVPPLVEP